MLVLSWLKSCFSPKRFSITKPIGKKKGSINVATLHIKTTILTTCINYSDNVSLKYGSQNKTWTAACNKSSDWHTVSSMYRPFQLYFAGKSDFRNVIQGQGPNHFYGMGGSCPNRASADQSMKPGNHCISYESMGSRSFSQNACSSKGYGAWIIIGSMLPDESYHFSCVGKTW